MPSTPPSLPRGRLTREIIKLIGLSGLLVAGTVCPGLFQLAKLLFKDRYGYGSFRQSFAIVDKKGWIAMRQNGDQVRIFLTKKGRAELQAYELGKKKIKKPAKWDGKWHILIFDIPEKRRRLRDIVRQTLKTFGFHYLQHSVWVYPHDCREVLELLRTRYGVRQEALYLRADHLDNDRWLRRHFEVKTS
jgi:phenylacetic acid degradation operon negative regulatory protein